jgi:hypothetical protein
MWIKDIDGYLVNLDHVGHISMELAYSLEWIPVVNLRSFAAHVKIQKLLCNGWRD